MNKFIKENLKNIAFIGIKKKLENGQTAFNIRGTGMLMNDKKVFTCAHVINEIPTDFHDSIFAGVATAIGDKSFNYDSYPIKLLKKNDPQDIALLSVDDPDNKLNGHGFNRAVLMSETEIDDLQITEELNFVGFPLPNEFLNMGMGVTAMASQCVLGSKKYKGTDDKIDFLLLDKLVNPGNSGSPVFSGDRIIGLASGTINQTHKIGETLINIPVGVGLVRTSNYMLEQLN